MDGPQGSIEIQARSNPRGYNRTYLQLSQGLGWEETKDAVLRLVHDLFGLCTVLETPPPRAVGKVSADRNRPVQKSPVVLTIFLYRR